MIRVALEHIHKTFEISFEKKKSFLRRVVSALTNVKHKKEIIVLDDLSLEARSGEILGIIGKNGSGKSTLLRIIAGIYRADSGNVVVRGKVVSIINLGIGFMERLTMEENIFLVGSLFGMHQKKIKEAFNSIVAFSELSEFVATPIYQFSAGMIQRLAFSIAIHADPDILVLDEVFEVGDESFKKKSADTIQELVRRGASVIFVTHDLEMVQKQAHRVIWLQEGKLHLEGQPKEVTAAYYA